MKNPLNKRMLRELRSEMGKYAVIAILLIATIGFVSGFLVAGSSMIAAYNEGFEKYNIEDGHFRVEKQLNRAQLKAITGAGVTLYDLHYRETAMENGSTLRIYPLHPGQHCLPDAGCHACRPPVRWAWTACMPRTTASRWAIP